MSHKMERFTGRAKHVLSLAQETAEEFNHNQIGTEHLLLGLIREEKGIAALVLHDLGAEQAKVIELIAELTHGAPRIANTALDLSPGTKKMLELAVDEARRMGHHYIGTEHLLLGLVRQLDGEAIEILKRMGVSPEEVRQQTRRVLQAPPAKAARFEPVIVDEPPSFVIGVKASHSFQILHVTILRIMDMIEAQKLSAAQGAELLNALQPWLLPTPGESLRLASLFNEPGVLEKRKLRLTITENATNAVQFELVLPLSEAIHEMDVVLNAALNSQAKDWLWTLKGNANTQIDIRIDEDESPTGESDAEVRYD